MSIRSTCERGPRVRRFLFCIAPFIIPRVSQLNAAQNVSDLIFMILHWPRPRMVSIKLFIHRVPSWSSDERQHCSRLNEPNETWKLIALLNELIARRELSKRPFDTCLIHAVLLTRLAGRLDKSRNCFKANEMTRTHVECLPCVLFSPLIGPKDFSFAETDFASADVSFPISASLSSHAF